MSREIGSSCGCWLGSVCGRLQRARGGGASTSGQEGKLDETQRREPSNMNTLRANPFAAVFVSLLFALKDACVAAWHWGLPLILIGLKVCICLEAHKVVNSGRSGLLFLGVDPLGLSWYLSVSKHVGTACKRQKREGVERVVPAGQEKLSLIHLRQLAFLLWPCGSFFFKWFPF